MDDLGFELRWALGLNSFLHPFRQAVRPTQHLVQYDGFLVFIPVVSGLERGVDYSPYLTPRLSFGRAVIVPSIGACNVM